MHRFAKIITAVFALIAGTAFGESTKPYSPDYPALERITADSLQKMGLQDEMLAMAYAEVFILNFDRVDDPPEWVVAAKNDLIRRGNSAAPLLLRMFETHLKLQDGPFTFAYHLYTLRPAQGTDTSKISVNFDLEIQCERTADKSVTTLKKLKWGFGARLGNQNKITTDLY